MQRLGHRGIDVHYGVIASLLDVEGEVAAGDDMDHLLDAHVTHAVGFLLAHVPLDEGVAGKPLCPGLVGAVVAGLGRGRWCSVVIILGGDGDGGRGGSGGCVAS